jgi:hypothetical protein
MAHGVDLRVIHVPGKQNLVADALSRFNNSLAISLFPTLRIYPLQPPQLALGAAKK